MADKWDQYIVDSPSDTTQSDPWAQYEVGSQSSQPQSVATQPIQQPQRSLYDVLGATITPQMQMQHPYLSAIAKTAQEGVATPAAHFINQALANTPRALLAQQGISYPESQGVAPNIASHTAGIAGIVQSPIYNAIGAIPTAASGVAKLAGEGGKLFAMGAAYSPDKVGDLGQRALQGVANTILGGAVGGTGAIFFRRQNAANELVNGAGKYLVEGRKKLLQLGETDPSFSVPQKDVVAPVLKMYQGVKDKSGAVGSAVKRWLQILRNEPNNLSPKVLLELEDQLGNVATYSSSKHGAMTRNEIPNKAMNALAKEWRTIVSDKVDALAQKAGLDKWAESNSKVHKILNAYTKYDPTKGSGNAFTRLITAHAAGAITGIPGAELVTYLGEKALQSPDVKNKFYQFLQTNGAKIGQRGFRAVVPQAVNQIAPQLGNQ